MTGRAWWFVALALAGAPAGRPELSVSTPSGGPLPGVMKGWQRLTGHAETKTERLSYELYVNPARAALYEVTRYRVTWLSTDPQGRPQTNAETEKFLWNAHPGAERLRCFELLADGKWVQMKTDSQRYRSEMGTAIHVYGLHRNALGLASP